MSAVQPRERPILFSAPMVRAILAGSKTQTRRVMNPQPYSNGFSLVSGSYEILCHNDYLPPSALLLDVGRGRNRFTTSNCEQNLAEVCPHGAPGDRLWVRETWAHIPEEVGGAPDEAIYRADMTDEQIKDECDARRIFTDKTMLARWRPSIFMPRWASRITLEITHMRVQRLQEISADDARAEGVTLGQPTKALINGQPGTVTYFDPVTAYAHLWNQINGGKRPGCDWASNPYVWAISFQRIESSSV